MIDTWNDTVRDNDEVLHLGDFAFKDNYKIAEKPKGNITLIVGNHDKKEHIIFYKKLGWKIIENIYLKRLNAILTIMNIHTRKEQKRSFVKVFVWN